MNLGGIGIGRAVVGLRGGGGESNRRRRGADEFLGFGFPEGEIVVFISVESLKVGLSGGGGSEVVEEEREDGEEGEEVEEGVASWEKKRERGFEE